MKKMYEALREADVKKLYNDFIREYPGLPEIGSSVNRGGVIVLYLTDEYEEEEVEMLRKLFLDPLEREHRISAEYEVDIETTDDIIPMITFRST